ncbi:PhzF family phenazine biosynthesis protein [Pseudomonas sp. CFII64]|uniref:PhzF family phenazine biosynthesis protein n=1 Tax=Pseudomonas sp. CFII64 TaxID=911242 RepID=UPI0003575690|nr:PhzF family phenazine biosynthesis protein [Pseudomonas sp. CFII64]EPJ88060.1 PhzF family phenazine biosynthesis protein [Pseudomonas sp. CFII64]
MSRFHFKQIDVFSKHRLLGNPLAVVLRADELSDARMAAFARWTNLSETTFVLEPLDPRADYRVRIFTTTQELPFAGHPTLGSCHAWLESGGQPKGEEIIQECGVGLIRIRRQGTQLGFTAPPLLRSEAVDAPLLERIRSGMGLGERAILEARWVDNGAGWLALRLEDRATVLALQPDYAQLAGLAVGVFAPWDPLRDGDEAQFEVRAFIAGDGMPEDPVTGSLNAGIAQWLLGAGLAPETYVVSQGTAMGRQGRVHVERVGDDIWISGEAVTCIDGTLEL